MSTKCILINKLNHPVVLSYNGEGLMLSPGSSTKELDTNKLGAIPKGVFKLSVKE